MVVPAPAAPSRETLRRTLRQTRERLVGGAGAAAAEQALASHLHSVLADLAPTELGLYWPLPGEFNAAAACLADAALQNVALALPFARRTPKAMAYHRWDRQPPAAVDDCGIPAPDGTPIVPEVVVVPCVGFTREGFRLGYGGGYFDRWLAAHPHVVAVGVAWAATEVPLADFAPQPHDLPLALVVTERGVAGG